MASHLSRLFLVLLSCLVFTVPAAAAVKVHFHSFDGSVLIGRYPHTFIVLDGTLEATGETINANYGFSALKITTKMLNGPVKHKIVVEPSKYVKSTNRHFSITITDSQYHNIIARIEAWKNAPGEYYDLDKRNCIHFVGSIASLLNLRIEYPESMLRRPKKWLNHIALLNPQIGARPID